MPGPVRDVPDHPRAEQGPALRTSIPLPLLLVPLAVTGAGVMAAGCRCGPAGAAVGAYGFVLAAAAAAMVVRQARGGKEG